MPVELPTEVVFEGVGSPLKKMQDWAKVACPSCGVGGSGGSVGEAPECLPLFVGSIFVSPRFGGERSRMYSVC